MPSSSLGTDDYRYTQESCCRGDSRIARVGTETTRRIIVLCRRDARPRASEPYRLRLHLRYCRHFSVWVLPTSGASGEAPLQRNTEFLPFRRKQPSRLFKKGRLGAVLLTQECPGLPPGIVILAAVVTAATAITATTAATTGGGHQAVPATAAAEEENEDDDPPAATETIVITHKEPS